MTLLKFIEAVDKLAFVPHPDRHKQMRTIWEQVREGAAHELATMQQQRDAALCQLHKKYLHNHYEH
jgi:hypothetical protein